MNNPTMAENDDEWNVVFGDNFLPDVIALLIASWGMVGWMDHPKIANHCEKNFNTKLNSV